MVFCLFRRVEACLAKRRQEIAETLINDISLVKDRVINEELDICLVFVGKLIKSGEKGIVLLLSQVINILDIFLSNKQGKSFLLEEFASSALLYSLIESIFNSNKVKLSDIILKLFDQILDRTFTILSMYKENSKNFIINIASSKNEIEKQIRRKSMLFTDILELLAYFCCNYLKKLSSLGHTQNHLNYSVQLWKILFNQGLVEEAGIEDKEFFTLKERLKILCELNSIFSQIPQICQQNLYWSLIQDGLVNEDNFCRKSAMTVLKNNIMSLGKPEIYKTYIDQEEFEKLWTIFFDLYDTLESFGSHLTKAVWERTELFYAFIQKHYKKGLVMHPLIDFKQWLLALYRRVTSHNNLKLRRYVQKSTLKRKYMTQFMDDFLFSEFLRSLNKGLIFKDQNIYTQFSKNQDMVLKFYDDYFNQESEDICSDMKKIFISFFKYVSHPQMILTTLLILAKPHPKQKGGFIGNEELLTLQNIYKEYFQEQFFSSRYLGSKYILQILTLYLDVSQIQTIDWSLIFKLIGKMPIEFFTLETIYRDNEGLSYASAFIDKLGIQNLSSILKSYLNDTFEIKALISGSPKFGGDPDSIIKGITRMLLILEIKLQDDFLNWISPVLNSNIQFFTSILNSSYLSSEVVDSKVHYFSLLMTNLYKYSQMKLKAIVHKEFFQGAHFALILDRLEHQLLRPLSQTQNFQEDSQNNQKLLSIFSRLDAYCKVIQLAIQMMHIQQNASHSGLEKVIKLMLELSLKVTSEKQGAKGIGPFMLQFVVFQSLKKIIQCYSKGIKQCLQKGVQYFFIPEDIFSFGKPILSSLVEFQVYNKPLEQDISQQIQAFLIDNDYTLGSMHQKSLVNKWKIISEIIQVFQFESQLKQELLLLYPQIVDLTESFLQSATPTYNQALFKILKLSYLPLLIQKLHSGDSYKQEEEILRYQNICFQCWKIIMDLQTEFGLKSLQQFLELAFSADVMEVYQKFLKPKTAQNVKDFHKKLAKQIFEYANKYWLISRTTFNHLIFIFVQRPHLISTYEDFIVNFAILREVRSLDSDIQMHRLHTIIPSIMSKRYENLNLEEITYQGAYIRTITLMIIEGMIKNHKAILLQPQKVTPLVLDFTTAFENMILNAFDMNFMSKYEKSDMPYSDKHRLKVRLWQFLIVCLDFVDPNIYTPQFRKMRLQQTQRDIVQEINTRLWQVLNKPHIPTIRQYIEIFAVRFILFFPQESIEDSNFCKVLLDPNIRPQVASSYITIAGFALTQPLHVQNAINLKQKIFEKFIGFTTSNSAHSRGIAQYFVYTLQKDSQFAGFISSGLKSTLDYLEQNKDTQRMIKKYDIEIKKFEKIAIHAGGADVTLSTSIDQFGEFMSVPFMETLRDITAQIISEIRHQDHTPEDPHDYWKIELERRKQEGEFTLVLNQESTTNYQRKILPWEQVEVSSHLQQVQFDHEQMKRIYEQRKRNDIIVCASLIDKIPNLGGLARTSEIMNASGLVINNRQVCQTDEFKGVSVTSEKWLPIYEVQEKDLYKYLEFQKSNGYTILGLEQTANSKMLNEYEFPKKCILLLGKEKEGIPQEYLSILDECIEIPQFGIIRSLNVHVSGALCIWEYTKQQIRPKNQ